MDAEDEYIPLSYSDSITEILPDEPSYVRNFFSRDFANDLNPNVKESIRTRSRQEILDAASVSLYTQNKLHAN